MDTWVACSHWLPYRHWSDQLTKHSRHQRVERRTTCLSMMDCNPCSDAVFLTVERTTTFERHTQTTGKCVAQAIRTVSEGSTHCLQDVDNPRGKPVCTCAKHGKGLPCVGLAPIHPLGHTACVDVCNNPEARDWLRRRGRHNGTAANLGCRSFRSSLRALG